MMAKAPKEKTTITLPVDLKRQAEHLAVETRRDLSDLIAEGLQLVLARHTKRRRG
jgi:predicted transcriptional regulator